jgi:uncharacterized protein (DUF1501 family)
MDRRDFFKLLGATGVTIPWWGYIPVAGAQAATLYTGKVLINIHASGGIDQSSWVDPRNDPTINNYAQAGTIRPVGAAGNIRFAPIGNNATFFTAYAPHMLVINGLHSETNDHGAGTQANATGRLDMGYPTLNELHAARHGKGLPMPWLNQGGFMNSVGLAPPTPVPNGNSFRALLTPNSASATNDFMKQQDLDKVLAARAERMAAFKANPATLPRFAGVSDQFLAASESRALLARVAQFLPATFDPNFGNAHVALIAAQAGITSTVQLSSGGFDTHSNNEQGVTNNLPRLLNMVDFIFQQATQLNMTNRIMVRVYSEFGRTALNNQNGKDHWSVGSSIILEANAPWANRVFGASGPRHQRLRINPTTGAVVADAAAPGVTITPRHVHDAMRRYLGIETTDPRFDLKVPAAERIDLFNPAAATGYPTMV